MLARSPVPHAEEWAIHDYDLGGVKIGEYESFATVSVIAKAVGVRIPTIAATYSD
jgi:antirestriction protein